MGQFYYVYGFLPAGCKQELPELTGMDKKTSILFIEHEEITAACSLVSSEEFSEKQMQKKVENMGWLKEYAYHHHEILDRLYKGSIIIPLSFGTVYESMDSLKNVISEHKSEMRRLFRELEGKEEWSVKIYADRAAFDKSFTQDEDNIQERKAEIAKMPRGKQFFALKKLDSWLHEKADNKIDTVCHSLHNELLSFTSDHMQKKVWEKKLSGRKEDMVWNCVYLFQNQEAVNSAVIYIREFQKRAEQEFEGLSVEATGPWPSYHFAKLQQTEVQ